MEHLRDHHSVRPSGESVYSLGERVDEESADDKEGDTDERNDRRKAMRMKNKKRGT